MAAFIGTYLAQARRTLARRAVLLVCTCACTVCVTLATAGCSLIGDSGEFYRPVSFANLTTEEMAERLDAGFTYDDQAVLWRGVPDDSPFDGAVAVSLYDEHDSPITADELAAGTEVQGVLVDWEQASFDEDGTNDIAYAVMDACGLKDATIDQAGDFTRWVCAGECEVGDAEAFWYVIVYSAVASDDGIDAQVYVGVSTLEAAKIDSYDELGSYLGLS